MRHILSTALVLVGGQLAESRAWSWPVRDSVPAAVPVAPASEPAAPVPAAAAPASEPTAPVPAAASPAAEPATHTPAAATSAIPAPTARAPTCADPPETRPPDPICGETLDGRPVVGPKSPAVGRGILWVPRLASRVVFWPIVTTTSFIEQHQLFPWMEAILTTDDKLIGVRPELQYASGFLPTAGLRFFDRRLPFPDSQFTARFRTAGPLAVLAEVSLAGPEWLGLDLHGTWDRRRDRLFAGIGSASNDELVAEGRGQARYGSDAFIAELRWSRRLPWWLIARAHGDVQQRTYTTDGVTQGLSVADFYAGSPATCATIGLPNGCIDPTLMPGFNEGLRMIHAGGGLAFDHQSRARDGGGFRLALDGTYGRGIARDPTRLMLLAGESVVAVGGSDRRLLLRVRASMVEPLDGTTVPFEQLVSPSGGAGMRGFPDGRFRDASGVVGTIEYRWFIAFNLDASLFVDAGTVAGPRFAGLRNAPVYPNFGIGIRSYASPAADYWLATPGSGIQLAYAPGGGLLLLVSAAPF